MGNDGSLVRRQSIAAAGSVCESISATKKVPATYVARTSHFFSTRRWPGERHEMIAAPELLDYASGDALIGDTGYDSNEFRAELKARGIKAVISSKPERKRKIPKNCALYRKRYLVEVFFTTSSASVESRPASIRRERATSRSFTSGASACGSIRDSP